MDVVVLLMGNIHLSLPLALACLLAGIGGGWLGSGPAASRPLLAGLGAPSAPAQIKRPAFLQFELPDGPIQLELEGNGLDRVGEPPITVKKSNRPIPVPFDGRRTRWHYLTNELRESIRSGLTKHASKPPWREVILHSSASRESNATILFAHQRNRDPQLRHLSYHFVIGNGTYSNKGEIEIGARWQMQEIAPAMALPVLNEDMIHVCLIGLIENTLPLTEQLVALDELLAYLRARLGALPLKVHRDVESTATVCPGDGFSDEVVRLLNKDGQS